MGAEKVQSYEEAFEKIKAATEINDIEAVEEQIAVLKNETESYKSAGGTQESQRRKIVSDLEEKLQKTIARADMYSEKTVQTQKTLGALKAGIQSIFEKIGCKDTSSAENLDEQGVTESTMIQYLGLIEERTNQILSGAVEDEDDVGPILGMGPQTPAGAIHLNVNPPTTGDDYSSGDESDDDDEDRPLTRDELKARTMRRLNKKDTQSGKSRKSKRAR